MAYIDLDATPRASCHPLEWLDCGYHEIQNPRQRFTIMDCQKLAGSVAVDDLNALAESHIRWLDELLPSEGKKWDECYGCRRKIGNQD
jgi:putative transposase